VILANPAPPNTSPGCLIDTNVLLRLTDAASTQHAMARAALNALGSQNMRLVVAPQNLIEFWVVATRPTAANGLGLTTAQAMASLAGFKAAFGLLADSPDILPEWERLTVQYAVQGKQAHDCRLVAFMRVYGITHLLTFNAGDFRRYEGAEGLTVIEPANLLATGDE
jgi:predicted nucleic acid-binding protein